MQGAEGTTPGVFASFVGTKEEKETIKIFSNSELLPVVQVTNLLS
jgi:hypothetical protein